MRGLVCILLLFATLVAGSEVVELTTENFDEKVNDVSGGAWFVKFFAPWCGHCKRLAPTWATFAEEMKGKVNVAHVDVTKNRELGTRFGVRGYPTLMLFKEGAEKEPIPYRGQRTIEAFTKYLNKQGALPKAEL